MKEVEVTVLEVDKPSVVKKILEMGGKKVFEGKVLNVIFDSNKTLNSRGMLLRLRKRGLQYKGKHCFCNQTFWEETGSFR